MKLILKSPRFFPFGANITQFECQICLPGAGMSDFPEIVHDYKSGTLGLFEIRYQYSLAYQVLFGANIGQFLAKSDTLDPGADLTLRKIAI